MCSWAYPPGVPPFRSPLDDAYRYYALQNLLNAAYTARESVDLCWCRVNLPQPDDQPNSLHHSSNDCIEF